MRNVFRKAFLLVGLSILSALTVSLWQAAMSTEKMNMLGVAWTATLALILVLLAALTEED